MRIPQPEDFEAITNWGMVENPHAAIDDFSEEKEQSRWNNDYHCRARQVYIQNQSEEAVNNPQSYHRTVERPIDRTKWEYLKCRKAWFHPPVGWNRFSAPGVSRIVDFGCGDGDLTQRVADHIAGNWLRAGYDGFPIEIVGVDINESRLSNARSHTQSPHDAITMRFEQADILDGVMYDDDYFDYGLMIGFLELFDDNQLENVLTEVTRLTAGGFYIRDILDDYPGMYPRPELDSLLSERGFTVQEQHKILKEPFSKDGTNDPLAVWPMDLNQVAFASADSLTPPEERY
ncbi:MULTISPECIES: class I SAM-dependent methyltransferase [Salinibaculum]|uniref:class I SAM-dependent methyltransferase n=1 Tax=Salinibaculum TaxID=2732368 RepID=UPI0030D10C7B